MIPLCEYGVPSVNGSSLLTWTRPQAQVNAAEMTSFCGWVSSWDTSFFMHGGHTPRGSKPILREHSRHQLSNSLIRFVHSRFSPGKTPLYKNKCSEKKKKIQLILPIVRTDSKSLLCQPSNNTYHGLWFACPPHLKNQTRWSDGLAIFYSKRLQIVIHTSMVLKGADRCFLRVHACHGMLIIPRKSDRFLYGICIIK